MCLGIGSNIKRILAERKMKISQLSEISGVKINTLYSITKRDSVNVNSDVLTAIATALDVSPFDLTVDIEQLRSDVKLQEEIQQVFGKKGLDLLNDFDSLNTDGKTKACEYVSDLTLIYPKNKKEPSSAATDNGSDNENTIK